MRSEAQYLDDIVAAADVISQFIRDLSFESFVGDDVLRNAILFKLVVIGEAVARLPPEFRKRYPDIEWSSPSSFRNAIVHGYFAVDWQIVWDTVVDDVPLLRRQVETIIATEYPPPSEEPSSS